LSADDTDPVLRSSLAHPTSFNPGPKIVASAE
jgi:hypothetical protein